MPSSFTSSLVADLTRDEGRKLRLYQDGEGNWTIGVGHNLTANGISDAICDALLAEDIANAEALLDRNFPWWRTLDEVRQRAVVNLAFNLGAKLLDFTITMGRLQARNYSAAADALLANGRWVAQVGPRAQRLAWMVRVGSTTEGAGT
jgi:lysozyme